MKEVQNIIFEELEDLRKRIISNIDSTGRRASGRTSGSMHTDVSRIVGYYSDVWLWYVGDWT